MKIMYWEIWVFIVVIKKFTILRFLKKMWHQKSKNTTEEYSKPKNENYAFDNNLKCSCFTIVYYFCIISDTSWICSIPTMLFRGSDYSNLGSTPLLCWNDYDCHWLDLAFQKIKIPKTWCLIINNVYSLSWVTNLLVTLRIQN